MEGNLGIKSEQFAWNDGRRIVDLGDLSKQLYCKQCSTLLDLQRTEKETRHGLASVLFILCNCGAMNDVHTGKMQHGGHSLDPIYEVNAKASVNLLMYGASRILSFLALLDIPLPAPDDSSLTVLVKEDTADLHSPSHGLPTEICPSYTSHAVSLAVNPNISRTCALQRASPPSLTCGLDSHVNSVPVALPSHQHWDRDNDDDHEDNDNSCDNSDSRSAAADGDLKERKKNRIIIDDMKADDCRGEHTLSNANRSHKENKEDEDGKDGYVPPMKIRAKAHNTHKSNKLTVEKSRKTPAATRKPLQVVVQKVPRTRAKQKVKKGIFPVESVKEQDKQKQVENNNKDFSNSKEWYEAKEQTAQDQDSDTSRQAEGKKEKSGNPKRCRGHQKSSADKVKRTGKRGTELSNSVSRKELGTEDVEANNISRCTACGKDFNQHMKRIHNQDGHHQDPRSNQNGHHQDPRSYQDGHHQETRSNQERQYQESHREEHCTEIKEPPVIAPERPGQVTQEEEVTAELFRCPRCSSVFSDPKNFFSHASRSHPTLETEEKGKLYPVPLKDSVMRRKVVHKDGSETISYQCCQCSDVFPSPSVLGNHLCIDSNSQLSCVAMCPDGAKIQGKAVELALGRGLTCFCNICGKVYASQELLKTHIKVVHSEKLFSCCVCGMAFNHPSRLQAHVETHKANRPRPFVCQFCGKQFFALDHLKKHESNQHLNSTHFSCPVCGKAFSTRRTRDSHKIIHSGHRTYSCSECFMKFYKKYNLTVHERIHSGVKPYKCSICPLTFAQKRSLDVHTKKHGPPSLCNICGKVYASQGILKKHIRVVHSEKKLLSCGVCGVSFSRRSNLQDHIETHKTNRPRPFVCQFCGKRFFTFKDLRTHERNQHNSALFLCPVCGKAFSTRRTRDSHMVIHSEQRTYSCSVCPMKFYKKYNLTVHERIHSGVKPYKCSVCPLAFAQKNSMNVHMKKHGQGIKN